MHFSELIKIGDILRRFFSFFQFSIEISHQRNSVDSHNIAGRSAADVKPFIVGPVGNFSVFK